MKKKLKKVIKWILIITSTYLIITTLILGHEDTDREKGIYNFYWSGINALWDSNKPFGFKINSQVETHLDGIDGPYVFDKNVFSVNEHNKLIKEHIDSSNTVLVKTYNHKIPQFSVTLKKSHTLEPYEYLMPEKIIAISDIEGNFNAFYSFMVSNKVIDENANWIFDKGHLVLNGDFFDRGNQVTQVLWLIYHLEEQAIKHGGKVHFILGNHEVMNLYGNVKYNDQKYIHIAKQLSKESDWDKATKHIFSQKSEIGKWLRTKNIVEKIGDVIFVHGGLNKFHQEEKYTLKELNILAKKYYGILPTEENLEKERDRIVVKGVNSPYWDRRLNFDVTYKMAFQMDGIDIEETTQNELNTILDYYNASKIVIGHSITDDIKIDYNRSVIKIDVHHGYEMNSGKTKGILIKNNNIHKLNDLGIKTKL